MRTRLSLAFIIVLSWLFSACFVQSPNLENITRVNYYHSDIPIAFPRNYRISITNSEAELIMYKRSGEHKLTTKVTEGQFKEVVKTVSSSWTGREKNNDSTNKEIVSGCCRSEKIELFADEKLVFNARKGEKFGNLEDVKVKLKSFFPDFESSFDEHSMP